MEYGFDQGIWGGISFVVNMRGNHALVLALFVLKIKDFFFGVIKHLYTLCLGNLAKSYPQMMIFPPPTLCPQKYHHFGL